PSSQSRAVPVHVPAWHASPVVQALPSLHAPVVFVWTHPDAGLQPSVVHGFASLQLSVVPIHVPAWHPSPVVHAFPSLHGPVAFACWQPRTGSHVSVVQGFPSLQLTAPTAHSATKLAVMFMGAAGAVRMWLCAPPSDQDENW